MGVMFSLEDLKSKYVGQTFKWLTVIDVFRNTITNKWMFHCRCKCGNTTDVQLNRATSGKVTSCGCYIHSQEFADKRAKWCAENLDKIRLDRDEVLKKVKEEHIGKVYYWAEVIDISLKCLKNGRIKSYNALCKCRCGKEFVTSLKALISGHTKSCGCYKTSKEFSELHKELCRNNPDLVKRRAEGHSKWCKEHPDEMKAKGERHSQFLKEHPEIVQRKSEKFKKWCAENPDKLKEQGERQSQYYKDHPEILEETGRKISEWYKTHPEEVAEKNRRQSQFYKEHPEFVRENAQKVSLWYKNNPDKVKEIVDHKKQWCIEHPDELRERGEKHSQYFKEHHEVLEEAGKKIANYYKDKRLESDFSILTNIIHPDFIEQLKAGEIRSGDIVKTKCPVCHEYDEHQFGNVVVLSRNEFKYGSPPLCNKCRSNLWITTSKYEQEIANYISTFYNGECIFNSRDIISPLELDLYYPKKKIAIEFNGDYWHSTLYKNDDYHVNKYLMCKESNVLLVSIFEQAWNNNSDEIKLYLNDLFNDKLNKLSIKEGCMNNNYPSKLLTTDDNILPDCYVCGCNDRLTVYTCGFSKIIGSV